MAEKKSEEKKGSGIKIVTENKKARFDYHILETFEAGMVLLGTEIKPIKAGQIQLKDSYVEFMNGEMFLLNAHISTYTKSSYNNHAPERKRKLLMKKSEINKLYAKVKEKGLSIVPLKVYLKKGFVKVEIAFVKGKKAHDKRDSIKKKDVDRELAQTKRKIR
jgi:SsrA-binding protein